MQQSAYYLRGTPDGWAVYPLYEGDADQDAAGPLAEGLDAQGVCQLIAERAAAPKQGGSQVVIGLPASWCLCATVSDSGLPRGSAAQHNQALRYRVEAALPISAEDCAIGLLGGGSKRLGIATYAKHVKQLVNQLEDEGHIVARIAPSALLAVQAWHGRGLTEPIDQPVTFCWSEQRTDGSETLELVHLDPGRAPRWRQLAAVSPGGGVDADLAAQLTIDGVSDTADERQWHFSEGLVGDGRFLNQDIRSTEALHYSIAAELQSARSSIQRPGDIELNLACGPLAPRYQWRRLRVPAYAAIAAAMLLLASVMVLLLIRAEQYNHIADRIDGQSDALFTEVMPGQPVPTSPQRRLKTRLKQLRGESGAAGGDQLRGAAAPALIVLHDLLESLPSDQRYAITDLRLEEGGIRLNGYAQSHGEADQLTDALRQSDAFVVEPPSTDKLAEGGVRFTLKAQHVQLDSAGPEAAPGQAKPTDTEVPSLANHRERGVSP